MYSAQYDFFADWERSWDATSSICSASDMPSVELPSTPEEEEIFPPIDEEYEFPQPVLRTAWVLENDAGERAQENTPTTTTSRRSRFVRHFDQPPMDFSPSSSSGTFTTTPSTMSSDTTLPGLTSWSSRSSRSSTLVNPDESTDESHITLLGFDPSYAVVDPGDVSLLDTAFLGELHLRTVDSRELQREVMKKDQTDKRIKKAFMGGWEVWRKMIKDRIGAKEGVRKVEFCWKEEVVV